MTTTSKTSPGPKRLSEIARKVVVPRDITSTSWPRVQRVCEKKLGLTFDDWQHGAGKVILAQRADGKLAAMIDGVGMSLPRQVGKTFLLAGIIFALCILRPGLLVIWSAHHSRTHEETFLSMQAFAERAKVAPYVRRVYTGSGDEEVRFVNGSRILFGARERGFGRGIPGVDVLVFDEAQILSEKALENMLATLNTSAFGLSLFIGTPPRPEDDSEVFERMRAQAYAGDLADGAWIEFGLDPDADPNDRRLWPTANPSHPKRTPLESMLRLQRKLKPEGWRHEGLGIWDEATGPNIMPKWSRSADLRTRSKHRPKTVVVGLACSVDGRFGSIGAAGMGRKGRLIVGKVDRREGQTWLVDEAKRLQDEHRVRIAVTGGGTMSSLLKELDNAGVTYELLTSSQYVDACETLARKIDEGEVRHPKHPDLDRAVRAAQWQKVGDRRRFARRTDADTSLVEAITVASALALDDYDIADSFG